jgi:GNAT superfamily N-acetyltransferase
MQRVVVRDYIAGDYSACRALWVELTAYHRALYGDPTIGGDNPGDGFDEYLVAPERISCWVAESESIVVGMTGLFDRGGSAEVEPVVVAEGNRGMGVGRSLIARARDEAIARSYEYLAIRPVARNVEAIRRFYSAGFRTLGGHVDLTLDLSQRRHAWLQGVQLHDLDFEY